MRDPARIHIMANGCLCCHPEHGDELERILDQLISISSTECIEACVIETSGLADPGPIIRTFLHLNRSGFELDSVVSLVDSSTFLTFFNTKIPIEMEMQLYYADTIVLTKMDLVDTADIKRIRNIVSHEYANAILYEKPKADQLLNVNTFNREREFNRPPHVCHTPNVHMLRIQAAGSVVLEKFIHWLDHAIELYARESFFRLKGFVAVDEDPIPRLIQCVLDTYTISPHPTGRWDRGSKRECDIVIIGQHLDEVGLKQSFLRCCSKKYA